MYILDRMVAEGLGTVCTHICHTYTPLRLWDRHALLCCRDFAHAVIMFAHELNIYAQALNIFARPVNVLPTD